MSDSQQLPFEKIYRLPQLGASPQNFKQGYEYWRSPITSTAYANIATNYTLPNQVVELSTPDGQQSILSTFTINRRE